MVRSIACRPLAIALVVGIATWTFNALPLFCGNPGPARAQELTSCNGWRLDKIEVGPGGIGQLVTAEGYFFNERALKAICNKQGRRYRMRPFKAEFEAGKNVPMPLQIGPFKVRLWECFGGTCGDEDAVRPVGYTAIAGEAGWGVDLPVKKDGYGALLK
eukprot:TRINITY_DN1813_c0_g1_i7.p1 TRINITY_DN1813_c0_g1~~TRINITY_DN1813_c0_g1_i7.p1  ORF type:complete len:159 (-),score=47.70 TRINITY_DN1813_c0_g1_i7:210-686(-)